MIIKGVFMSVTRPGNILKCTGCGKTGAEKKGANNWKMCDTCFTPYCYECFRSIKHAPSYCNDHKPWGKWLTAGGSAGVMAFD